MVVKAALAQLEERRAEVNDLNVFPVADGDTGDNMALTLEAVVAELDRLAVDEERSIAEIGRGELVVAAARAALLGARGNSGVILSQLIRGAAEELASRPGELVAPVLIRAALARAAQRADRSVRARAGGGRDADGRARQGRCGGQRARPHARSAAEPGRRSRGPEPAHRRHPR